MSVVADSSTHWHPLPRPRYSHSVKCDSCSRPAAARPPTGFLPWLTGAASLACRPSTRELHLPNYTSAATLRDKLLLALDHGTDGFLKQ